MGPLTSSPYYHKNKGMFTEVWLSHWLSVVANTVLGCLHPVIRAYFASVPEEHAAFISRASTCKVEMANLPPRCQQHNPLLHGIRRERDTHIHTHTHTHSTHTGGFETCTLARCGTHMNACTHTHPLAHACTQVDLRHAHLPDMA
jgi:ribosomal protein L34E